MNNHDFRETTWRCCYHLVFVPRNRAIGAYGMVKREAEVILQRLCRKLDVEVLLLEGGPNYVHMRLSIPPWRSPLEVVRCLKNVSSNELFQRYTGLSPMLSGRIFWTDGCLLDTQTPGKRMIQDYIDKQLQADWAAECRCGEDFF